MPIGRRRFIVSAAVVGTGVLTGLRWRATTQRQTALDQITARLRDAAGVIDLGIEYLSRTPDERDDAALAQRLANEGDLSLRGVDASHLIALLDTQIGADFEAGRVLLLGGWMLSQTELRLCALTALRSRPDHTAPLGLFAPTTLPDGEPVRWSTPLVTLSVPGTLDRVVLPIRNPAPFDRTVSVRLDGQAADEVTLTGTSGWRPLEYQLGLRAGSPRRLDLDVSPAWSPADDFRTIGVGVGDVEWLRPA